MAKDRRRTGADQKDADAFRTISEVADELGLEKHVLRFWEVRFPALKPMKRGGNRRFYRREDVDLLRGIKRLLHGDRFTIEGVQKILKEQGVEAVKKIGRGEAEALDAQGPVEAAVATAAAGRRGRRAGGRAALAVAVNPREALLRGLLKELQSCRALLAA